MPLIRTLRIRICSDVKLALASPRLAASASTVPALTVPQTSLTIWPYAADVSVASPNATPIELSIRSPA